MENFLPNVQWQLWSGTSYITKMGYQAYGTQLPVSCTGFQTVNNAPTFYTACTQQLKVGDIVLIEGGGFVWSYPGAAGSPTTAVRVVSVVTNVSFTVASAPLGAVSPATSFATFAVPITAGDYGSMTGSLGSQQAADGWVKSPTLAAWADDFSVNSVPGATRTMGVKKGSAGLESLYWECPNNQQARYLGRQVTFGVLVMQKIQSGAGTFALWAYDSITGVTTGAQGCGASYSNPASGYGGFQFLTLTVTPALGSTGFMLGVEFTGNVGDAYFVALPTASFGCQMGLNDLGQNISDVMRSVVHWNPPLLAPLSMTFPTTLYPSTAWYGYACLDLEAVSLGAVHKSVAMVKCKIEFSAAAGVTMLTMSEASLPQGTCVFGPEATALTPSYPTCDSGWLPLNSDGQFAIMVDRPGAVISNATFDFDCVQLSMAGAGSY